jgi:flagella basal body P-ring formation protein FlgA
MIRIVTLVCLLAPPLCAAAIAQAADAPTANAPMRTAQFSDRFGGEPSGRPAPTFVKGSAQVPALSGPTLRAEAIVTGDLVRIGDLIENAGVVADVAIFRAPDLGQTGSVPVSRVIDAVRPHQIVGLETRGVTEIAVTRASRLISAKDIEARIMRALAGQQNVADTGNLAVSFDNEVRTLQVEPSASAELRVMRLVYDPRNGRFDVTFDLPGSAVARRVPLRFTGTISETFDAVVPIRPIAAGEVLKASDLTVARRPKAEFAANVVLDTAQAVGRTSRRALRPGQAVRVSELAKVEVVQRNESLTITYEVPGVMLSVRGQALEAGALGEVINVLNVQSKKTIRGTIVGPGHVTIEATTARIVANAAISPSNGARPSAK